MSARLRTLVVDDDTALLGAISRVLLQLGHEPVCVPSVEQAVHHLSRAPVDLLLLDLRLPGIDGMTLLKQLHAKSVPVPVIVMSGGKADREVLALGARFLSKPFGAKELGEAIAQATIPVEPVEIVPDDPSVTPIERARGAFRARVRELLKGDGLPILDARVERVHELLVAPECSSRDVEEVIGNDPRLTADVLRAANSAQFRGASVIATLGDAIVRLGNKEVMGIVMNASIRAAFPIASGFWRELIDSYWETAVSTARLAKQLSASAKVGNPDELFVGGLLHNVGELIAVCALAGMPERNTLAAIEPELRGLIASQHEALGQRVLTFWELPILLARLAGDHHGPLASLEPERLLVRCAWELRVASEERPLPEGWEEAMDRLQLKSSRLEVVLGYRLPPARAADPEESSDAA
jgi:HD-like signal output (HDOD) protein/CheY-like chemotaxis protein